MATQDEYIKTALRLPRSLHADIQASAKELGRSMNAEIIARLQASFDVAEAQPRQESMKTPTEIIASLGVTGEDQADRVADKVVSRLISTDEFIKRVQESLRIAEDRTVLTDKLTSEPSSPAKSATPAIPGVNAPKGGSKSPKG